MTWIALIEIKSIRPFKKNSVYIFTYWVLLFMIIISNYFNVSKYHYGWKNPHIPRSLYTHIHNHPHISRTFHPPRNIMKFWFTCLPAICGQQHVNSICCCSSAFSFPTNTAVRLANRTWVKLDLKSLLPCQGRHWIRIDWHFILLQSVVVISFISFRWRFWPWSASGVRSNTGNTYNLYDNIATLQKMHCNTWFWDDRRNCEEGQRTKRISKESQKPLVGKCGKERMEYTVTAGSTSWDEQNSTSLWLQFGGLHIS